MAVRPEPGSGEPESDLVELCQPRHPGHDEGDLCRRQGVDGVRTDRHVLAAGPSPRGVDPHGLPAKNGPDDSEREQDILCVADSGSSPRELPTFTSLEQGASRARPAAEQVDCSDQPEGSQVRRRLARFCDVGDQPRNRKQAARSFARFPFVIPKQLISRASPCALPSELDTSPEPSWTRVPASAATSSLIVDERRIGRSDHRQQEQRSQRRDDSTTAAQGTSLFADY